MQTQLNFTTITDQGVSYKIINTNERLEWLKDQIKKVLKRGHKKRLTMGASDNTPIKNQASFYVDNLSNSELLFYPLTTKAAKEYRLNVLELLARKHGRYSIPYVISSNESEKIKALSNIVLDIGYTITEYEA